MVDHWNNLTEGLLLLKQLPVSRHYYRIDKHLVNERFHTIEIDNNLHPNKHIVFRALTRIFKTGVPEPSLPKSGSPTIQEKIASLKKIGVPAPNMGVQNCKLSVSESSGLLISHRKSQDF